MSSVRSATTGRIALWLWVLRLFYGHKLVFFVAMLCMVVVAISEPLFPWLLGGLVDGVLKAGNIVIPIDWLPLILFLLFITRAVMMYGSSYCSAWLQWTIEYELRCQAAARLLRWPAQLLKQTPKGEVIYKVLSAPTELCISAVSVATTIIQSVLKIIGCVVLLFYLDWYLTSLLLLVMPPIAALLVNINKRIQKKSEALIVAHSMGVDLLSELLKMWQVIRVFGGERVERDKQKDRLSRIRKLYIRLQKVASCGQPVTLVIMALPVALLAGYYLEALRLGEVTPGEVTAYMAALAILQMAIRNFAKTVNLLPRVTAYASSLIELNNIQLERDSPVIQQPGEMPGSGNIVFDQVCFSYPGKTTPALDKLSLEIKPGETIALVGATGSGKSTMISLLLRLFEPGSGKLTFFGRPIQDWSLSGLRSCFSIVTQEPLLFADTVARNISYPAEPDYGRVEAVLREIGGAGFVSELPGGLDTVVSSDNLSGGQQQLLALARAFYRSAPVVIFDEATSNLDNASEQLVKDGARRLFAGRIAIVIAHRLSSLELADRVVVMDKGTIIDHGGSKELLERCPQFRELWQGQHLRHSS